MNDVLFRNISDDEYEKYKDWEIKDYAGNLFKEGQYDTLEEAMKESIKDFNEGLPAGLETPDHYLLKIQNSENKDIGFLWYETTNKKRAFIEDFVIEADYRRKGYGMKTLRLLEHDLIDKGIYQIVLHVFESNSIARRLYEKAGFTYLDVNEDEPGSLYMLKALTKQPKNENLWDFVRPNESHQSEKG